MSTPSTTDKKRVLIVEDEPDIVRGLTDALEFEGFSVEATGTGGQGIEAMRKRGADCVLLDLMLPDTDGYKVCEEIRGFDTIVPIIILTARGQESDKIRGLEAGADDYMTKPFSFEEFLARLRSVSRRGAAPRPTLLQVGDLVLNPASHEVKRDGEEISLSRTEFRLLEFLMRRAGRVVPRNTIVHSVWDSHEDVEENTLDVFISLLRNKVDRDHKIKLIQTVRGTGYAIRDTTKA